MSAFGVRQMEETVRKYGALSQRNEHPPIVGIIASPFDDECLHINKVSEYVEDPDGRNRQRVTLCEDCGEALDDHLDDPPDYVWGIGE